MTRRIAADPYPWPYNGDLRPGQHGADHHRHADRFLRPGRLCRHDGLRPVADPRADRADQGGARRRCAPRATTSSTRAKATGPTSPTCRPTSAGARSGSARASATRAPAAASSCAASRAGTSSPSSRPLPGESIIDKPGKGSFCATDLELILRTQGHREHRPHRHHHRCLRPHDDARGQRPRLRMPAARGLLRRDRHGNHLAAIKMVKMQGGVFGAVSDSATADRGAAMNAAAEPHRRQRRRRRRDASA